MMTRKLVLMACLVVLAGVAVAVTSDARTSRTTTNRLAFNRSVALPGVVLAPGTYTFEAAPVETHPEIVRVLSADNKVMFLGFTHKTRRPRGIPDSQVISVGEAPAGNPVPIKAWYPVGTSMGHEFLW
jgi:hypothetical protein